MGKILLEKPIIVQLENTFLDFSGTRTFIAIARKFIDWALIYVN
jgi:hypothetical protein